MLPLERHPIVAVDDLPWMIVADFDEHPGQRLTFWQIQRSWNLPSDECARVLRFLVDIGILGFDGIQYTRL
jgi:hypothetical protein